MTIQQLIEMANRRIAYLGQARLSAERIGDVDAVTRIDTDIAETEATLTKLQTLLV
jgi:hypothetical protein